MSRMPTTVQMTPLLMTVPFSYDRGSITRLEIG